MSVGTFRLGTMKISIGLKKTRAPFFFSVLVLADKINVFTGTVAVPTENCKYADGHFQCAEPKCADGHFQYADGHFQKIKFVFLSVL